MEIAYDIRKCYENVPHHGLAIRAKSAGYPTRNLRVSMASYRWLRTLKRDRLVSHPLYAVDLAIIAGNAFATYELKAYMLDAIRAYSSRFVNVTLGIKSTISAYWW